MNGLSVRFRSIGLQTPLPCCDSHIGTTGTFHHRSKTASNLPNVERRVDILV